jgi:holo-[acyl-carrier protein] synthase
VSGVGFDLIDISRLERALERRPRLAERLFSERERAYAASRARPGQHLAARFCAKEAVTKALALDVFRPAEIEVESGPSGEPRALLSGAVAARANALGVVIEISLTHTGSTAGAVALAVAR